MNNLTNKQARKLALIYVEPEGFAALFRKGMKFRANMKITEGIPKDAVVEYVFASAERNGVLIMISSKEFQPVDPGVMPPIIPIEISVGKE